MNSLYITWNKINTFDIYCKAVLLLNPEIKTNIVLLQISTDRFAVIVAVYSLVTQNWDDVRKNAIKENVNDLKKQ